MITAIFLALTLQATPAEIADAAAQAQAQEALADATAAAGPAAVGNTCLYVSGALDQLLHWIPRAAAHDETAQRASEIRTYLGMRPSIAGSELDATVNRAPLGTAAKLDSDALTARELREELKAVRDNLLLAQINACAE